MLRLSRKSKVAIAAAAGVVLTIATGLAIKERMRARTVAVIRGAVIADSKDLHLQRPIGNATVTVRSGPASWKAVSEVSGLFRVRVDPPLTVDDVLELRVEHALYRPLTVTTAARDQIYVMRLTPAREQGVTARAGKETRISNIRVRYATRSTSTTTVGTAVRTFDIANTGNVPCGNRPPCSPDGRWKAAIGSLSLNTGEQNKQFRNARVSCIAGPCPFTAVEKDGFSRGGRAITVSVRNWSDSVTYLLEAEVALTMESDLIRHTYPVMFGRSMNFTLPAIATGPSIEAEVDGSEVVFPLGPDLRLSWATCRFEAGPDGTKQYRCELTPGFGFD